MLALESRLPTALTLAAGSRLGPYEILSAIGAGGMGEVSRATDTNLKRQVAIKVLASFVAADPERLARFQREAEILTALNHPNIAAIYGRYESDGRQALVLELRTDIWAFGCVLFEMLAGRPAASCGP